MAYRIRIGQFLIYKDDQRRETTQANTNYSF
jgi:hypothetical protein